MIKNYIKIAVRNLQRNRVYSLINILGLTIGLAACLMVATVVIDDLSYDRQWKHSKDIYRIITVDNSNNNEESKFPESYSGLGPTLQQIFPAVNGYCRLSTIDSRLKLGDGKDGIMVNGLSTEPNVWKLFDFNVVQGDPEKFTKGYVNLVITEKLKNEFFPHTNPIGKFVYTVPDYGKSKALLITGVIKNMPSNTHLRADALEIKEFRTEDDQLSKNGDGTFYSQYLLLKPGVSTGAFTSKVNAWYKNYMPKGTARYSYQFQPLKDVYLKSDFAGYQLVKSSMRNVYVFSAVAALLLLIGCINFVNLTTARALKRLREAGIRKVLGAGRTELIGQFLFESLLFFLISFVFGLSSYSIFLGSVEKFLEHPLALNLFDNGALFTGTCSFVLLISVLTGLYPAFLLSGKQPAETISGKLISNTGGGLLRKGLVVVQFSIAIIIIIAAVVVYNQLQYMSKKDLGFNKNNLLELNFTNWEGKGKAFKQSILNLSGVENASISSWTPSGGGGTMSMQFDDPNQRKNKITVWFIEGDRDLAATLQLKIEKGRLFDSRFTTDAVNSDSLGDKMAYKKINELQLVQPVIITRFTAKTFKINQLNSRKNFKEGIPVGIIKDFNNESLHNAMKPTVIRAIENPKYGNMLVRVNPNATKQVLSGIHRLWDRYYPEKAFQFSWVDESLDSQYKTERKLQELFTFFSLLVVLLACLGLFGLAAFTAEQRIKEIGIRKVLGASVANITALLSGDFLNLVFLAALIASPIAWYAMNKWLQDFAYRITIEWWVFALAGIISMLIAFFTVSFQSIKSAIANPVKSLRSE